ncbi:HD-GYP domain-containing protein [Candidatus Velamenicoccus archaeovorus]|uniref:HD-GYP domain-containing protein n=1 Tax=Velamenicoccus archaeovorus TaxID=1930593 RepID=UPI001E3F1391|nr:HD domain-containing phosphohydrolase [Candidatus Velamenicoccus archaeovorus]
MFLIIRLLNKDKRIFMHGKRVADIACAIAKKMQYCAEGIRQVRLAAFFHDIGKIEAPEQILNKPSALNKKEIAILRRHPESGYRLLEFLKPDSIIAEVALQHHERLDGSGYPFSLRVKDINPVARIIAVADVVDTMTSPQVYRPASTVDQALQEIKQNSGLLYDVKVVDAALAVIAGGGKLKKFNEALKEGVRENENIGYSGQSAQK